MSNLNNNTFNTLKSNYNTAVLQINNFKNNKNINNIFNGLIKIVNDFKSKLINFTTCNNDIETIYNKYLNEIDYNNREHINGSNLDLIFFYIKKETHQSIHDMYNKIISCAIKSEIEKLKNKSKTPATTTPATITPATYNNKFIKKLLSERGQCSDNNLRFILLQIIKILEELLPEYKLNIFKSKIRSVTTGNINQSLLNYLNKNISNIFKNNN